jgi:hypothetical protein
MGKKRTAISAVLFFIGAVANSYPWIRRVATAPGLLLLPDFMGNTSFTMGWH